MQDGDLGTWDKPRIILVLEDTCCHISSERKGWRRQEEVADPDDWDWAITTVKTILRWSYNSVPVEVVTFVSQDVADLAAEWFNRYDVEVAEVYHRNFAHFCRGLMWRRNNIQQIIDTDLRRIEHYGQLGRAILWDSEF